MRPSLRLRVAVTFAWFGALVSLLLATGLYFAAADLGRRLMDETLRAEMDDYLARRARNPQSLPPQTLTLRGYVLEPGTPPDALPPPLHGLPPGQHEVRLDGIPYRVAVAQRGHSRYLLLFDERAQRQRERHFLFYLVGAFLIMTLLSAAGGYWLAGRLVAPVTRLARQIRDASPEGESPALARHFSEDELGEMARAVDGYIERLRAFIEREKAFTADVSHELRTPLAVIQGAVDVLEADPALSDRQRQRLSRIARAVRDMSELTAALLIMAREPRREGLGEETCSLREAVLHTVETHRHLMEGRPARLELDLRADPRLAVEPILLGIVIGNLIRNAFSYTEQGVVTVRLLPDRLVVADTGIGIRTEELARVFQRYYRGATSQGAGIGLSLVKRICDRYGWRVQIDSRENEGTTAQLIFAPEDT